MPSEVHRIEEKIANAGQAGVRPPAAPQGEGQPLPVAPQEGGGQPLPPAAPMEGGQPPLQAPQPLPAEGGGQPLPPAAPQGGGQPPQQARQGLPLQPVTASVPPKVTPVDISDSEDDDLAPGDRAAGGPATVASQAEDGPAAGQEASRLPRGLDWTRIAVQKSGDRFVRFTVEQVNIQEQWLRLWDLRIAKCSVLRLQADEPLPYSSVIEVIREFRAEWEQQDKTRQQRRDLEERCCNMNVANRTWESVWRTRMYQLCGGTAWATWFVAIGDLPDDLFGIANEYWNDRVEALTGESDREPGVPHPKPRLAPQALARQEGLPVPEKMGKNI